MWLAQELIFIQGKKNIVQYWSCPLCSVWINDGLSLLLYVITTLELKKELHLFIFKL